MRATVLVPAYNAERYLHDALSSVAKQTYSDFEVIVIDDGSSDRTRSIAEKFAQQDRRFRVISRQNLGLCISLNEGLEIAQGDWVFIMHADDVMAPNRVERQLHFVALNPDLAVASSFVWYINSNDELIGQYTSGLTCRAAVDAAVTRGELIGFHHPAAILNRRIILAHGGYRQSFWPCEDVDLWNRLVERGHMVLVQPEFLMYYRIHGASASSSKARLLRQKHRWVEASMQRRRAGRAELSWDGFLALEHEARIVERVLRERRDLGHVFYKNAVTRYANKEYFKFASNLVLAVLFAPYRTVSEVMAKYKRPTAQGSERLPVVGVLGSGRSNACR